MGRARSLVLASCLLVGCGVKSGSPSVLLFPESNEVAGWSKVGETRIFKAGDLWKYVDGDAEKYIQAGVQETFTANYSYKNSIDAAADIHVMATTGGPGKIMDSESSQDSQPVPLGDSGRLYGASLIFRKGPYLVRLVAFKQSPEVGKALVELARGIERKLGQQVSKQTSDLATAANQQMARLECNRFAEHRETEVKYLCSLSSAFCRCDGKVVERS